MNNISLKNAKIAIIGLGYVGLPLAVKFGKIRTVVGFDINKKRYFSGNQGWKIYWDTLSSVSFFELILKKQFHQ